MPEESEDMPLEDNVQGYSNTTPAAGGSIRLVHQNSDLSTYEIEEDVTWDQSTQALKSSVLLSQQLPPSASVRWAELQNVTDIAVTGNDATITANGIALIARTDSAPVTGTTSGSSFVLCYIGSTASSSRRRNKPDVYTQGVNGNTSPMFLYLVPAVPTNTSTNAGLYVGAAGTQTITSGYKFGTATSTSTVTQNMRVRLFVDVFRNMPS